MRAGRLCDLCYQEECDGNFIEVIGWAKNRRDGGTNHVIARRETGRRIGPECLLKLRKGELAGEQTLPIVLPGVA